MDGWMDARMDGWIIDSPDNTRGWSDALVISSDRLTFNSNSGQALKKIFNQKEKNQQPTSNLICI